MNERRDGIGLLPAHGPCPHCGQDHGYITAHIETKDGEIVCGIPVLWTEQVPPFGGTWSGPCVDPPHGLQVMLATRRGFRLAIVWRADERAERKPDLTLDEAAAIWDGRT
jgi:hypothetical protein